MSIITLATDFGTHDWFVGSMKGVILGVNPEVTVVDITHEIPAGDIRAGAFALSASYRCFPRNTVHVAVVDPGVGSGRAAIGVKTADYFFVGPDNGVHKVCVPDKVQCESREFYEDAPRGQPLALVGSSGFLEIAVNGGSAARMFALALGDTVEVR